MLGIAAFFVYLGFNIPNELVTTKIGLVVMIVGMLTYLLVHNQLLPTLFKTNPATNITEYLAQLITIKRKEDFLNKVMINIYFVLLCIGMGFYLWQFIHGMWNGILTYSLIFAWILTSWLYLRPRGVKRKQKPLLETIAHLRAKQAIGGRGGKVKGFSRQIVTYEVSRTS